MNRALFDDDWCRDFSETFHEHFESLGDRPYDYEFEFARFFVESMTVEQAIQYRAHTLTCDDANPMFLEWLDERIAGMPVNKWDVRISRSTRDEG